jgi:hypothetical protein
MNRILAAALLSTLSGVAAAMPPGPRPEPQPAPQGAPLTGEALRVRIEAYLGSIDTPIGADRWRALGPEAAGVLASHATSASELPTRRARALAGLAAVGGTRAEQVVADLVRKDGEAYIVRLAAMRAAAEILPERHAAALLRPLMEKSPEARLRAAAAEALARGSRAACPAVEAQAGREEPEERVRFEQALARCRD